MKLFSSFDSLLMGGRWIVGFDWRGSLGKRDEGENTRGWLLETRRTREGEEYDMSGKEGLEDFLHLVLLYRYGMWWVVLG